MHKNFTSDSADYVVLSNYPQGRHQDEFQNIPPVKLFQVLALYSINSPIIF